MEPTIKLQNFVAGDIKVGGVANNQNSRFTSIKESNNRKASEMTDDKNPNNDGDEYDDDFESLSKSQAGLSMSLGVKKNLNKNSAGRDRDDDSYSNEFESIGDSKTISNDIATVICFMCKQQIPKSQAL